MSKKYEKEIIAEGKVLERWRKQERYTFREVSEYMDKSISWLSDVEKGRIGLLFNDAKKLVHFYGHTLDDFVEETDQYLENKKRPSI